MNKMIEKFIEEYARVPKFKEYKALGGKLSHTSYYLHLDRLGYERNKGRVETVEVLVGNEVIFKGTVQEVADRLFVSEALVKQRYSNGKEYNGYTFRRKLFKGYL